jgi:hypothetical protein
MLAKFLCQFLILLTRILVGIACLLAIPFDFLFNKPLPHADSASHFIRIHLLPSMSNAAAFGGEPDHHAFYSISQA